MKLHRVLRAQQSFRQVQVMRDRHLVVDRFRLMQREHQRVAGQRRSQCPGQWGGDEWTKYAACRGPWSFWHNDLLTSSNE
ncbi:MAG: hypothetical protein ABI456_18580 [Ktedonobacteraceae bacterium]